jgi:hypothetical protein
MEIPAMPTEDKNRRFSSSIYIAQQRIAQYYMHLISFFKRTSQWQRERHHLWQKRWPDFYRGIKRLCIFKNVLKEISINSLRTEGEFARKIKINTWRTEGDVSKLNDIYLSDFSFSTAVEHWVYVEKYAITCLWSAVAEWLGCRTLNQRVVGLNPGVVSVSRIP